MPHEASCVFCKIVTGQIPSAKVLDTEAAVAFLDIAPVTPGHVLLVPKEHYATLAETPAEVLSEAATLLPRLARAIRAVTGAPGLNVVQNNGREAGQVVDHVHFHLIPRWAGDEFRVHWPHGKYSGDELEQMRARMAAAL